MKKKFLTSRDKFHTHTWNPKDKKTSVNAEHSHPINLKKMLAEKGIVDHTHKLLKTIKKNKTINIPDESIHILDIFDIF